MKSQVFNCLIVDDEPPAREVLTRYIQTMPMLKLIGECSNALQVYDFLRTEQVDIMFLDIQMPQLSGLELINSLSHPPKIIFTTAFSEYALESYELNAVDYLLKPIKLERFIKAVNKAFPMPLSQQPDKSTMEIKEKTASDAFLYFRAERKMVKVILKEVKYIESLKDYVKIITDQEQVITKYSMAALEAMLPFPFFLRIHRSFIINVSKLKSYTTTHVQIENQELPIGKLYQREVLKAFGAGENAPELL